MGQASRHKREARRVEMTLEQRAEFELTVLRRAADRLDQLDSSTLGGCCRTTLRIVQAMLRLDMDGLNQLKQEIDQLVPGGAKSD